MPAYNFQKRFAPLVQSGQKRQTIRAIGKRRSGRLLDGREWNEIPGGNNDFR